MRLLGAIAALALLAAGQTTVVDRIVAVVNGTPVLASEVRDAGWYARLSAGQGCAAPLSAEEQATALRHLEDAELLEEAAAAEGFAAPDESAAAGPVLARLRAQVARCHLDDAAARGLVERQLRILAYLDQHFAGQPDPTDAQVRQYYDATFVPEARGRGLAPAPLARVQATIAALLRQRQRLANEQTWVQQLRAEAKIEVLPPW